MAGSGGIVAPGLQVRGGDGGNAVGAESREIECVTVRADHHLLGLGQAQGLVARRQGRTLRQREVDMRIEVVGSHRAAPDHADALFGDIAAHAAGGSAGPLEADPVAGLGVADVDCAGSRVAGDVEQHCAQPLLAAQQAWRAGHGIQGKQVQIRQVEEYLVRPVAAGFIDPALAIEAHDQAGIRLPNAFVVLHGTRLGVGDFRFVEQGSGLVAGEESRRVHPAAVGAAGEAAGTVGKQVDDRQGLAARPCAGRVGIEHPDIGAAQARGLEIGGAESGVVLAAVGGGNKRAPIAGAGEDNVPGLVSDQQGANHAGRGTIQADNADAVRQMVDYPGFAAAGSSHRHRFQAHRHTARGRQLPIGDVEQFQPVSRGVDHKQPGAIG